MRAAVNRRQVLKGLLAGGLLAVPAPAPAPAAAAVPPEPARCACRRHTGHYAAHGGAEPVVEYTLTYRCPRCGKPVVERGFRDLSACALLSEALQ